MIFMMLLMISEVCSKYSLFDICSLLIEFPPTVYGFGVALAKGALNWLEVSRFD